MESRVLCEDHVLVGSDQNPVIGARIDEIEGVAHCFMGGNFTALKAVDDGLCFIHDGGLEFNETCSRCGTGVYQCYRDRS
jgi:hypothetical protein